MHRRHRHPDPARVPRLRPGARLARIALGVTVALAVLSAGFYVFVPFSDLSARQLAAGPHAMQAAEVPAAIVRAHTGRAWGAAAVQRQAAAASKPVAQVARRDTRDP